MRVIVARCAIGYSGRLTTRLGSGDRVLLFKDDGSVVVHALRGAKPINYMPGPTVVEETGDVIAVRRPDSEESLVIVVEELHSDVGYPELVDDATLEREGRELEIHQLLALAPDVIEDGLIVVERERPTAVGPVDLVCRDAEGRLVLVEVKRVRAVVAAVEQVVRYREQVAADPGAREVRALLVAPDFAPQARVLAGQRAVECVILDVERLRGSARREATLF